MFSDHRRRDSDGRSEVVGHSQSQDHISARTSTASTPTTTATAFTSLGWFQKEPDHDNQDQDQGQVGGQFEEQDQQKDAHSKVFTEIPQEFEHERRIRAARRGLDSAGTWDLRLALGFWAGVSRQSQAELGRRKRSVLATFSTGHAGINEAQRFRQELGLAGMTVTKRSVLPDTPAFLDEPADWFSTAA